MKKILIITTIFLTTARLFAQDCSKFVFMKKGRTIETTSYNFRGAVTHKVIGVVNDVTTANGTTTSFTTNQNFDAKGKPSSIVKITYKCDNGVLNIDVSSLNQPGSFQFSTAIMNYPSTMTVGEHFPDVSFSMTMNMGGKTITSNAKITDRTAVDEESITTPAGTWKCFKMTYNITSTVTGMTMPPMTVPVTEWYVPGFAIVQYQMGSMITKITAIKD